MKIVVKGPAESHKKLKQDDIEWIAVKELSDFSLHADADAYFILDDEALRGSLPAVSPLFVNSVKTTLKETANTKAIRINGWNGFLERSKWDYAGEAGEKEMKVFKSLNITPVKVKDEPGLVAARVLSMIINEAFFALQEEVSTESEIDTAMKLGTNYPKGPFEWGEYIGMNKIFSLLKKIAATDSRYQPAPLLAEKWKK